MANSPDGVARARSSTKSQILISLPSLPHCVEPPYPRYYNKGVHSMGTSGPDVSSYLVSESGKSRPARRSGDVTRTGGETKAWRQIVGARGETRGGGDGRRTDH